jgi:hypothetical protein
MMAPLRQPPEKVMFGAWAFFTLVLASMTFAVPLDNTIASVHVSKHKTSLGTMTFATEPGGRGTWKILFSCTTTLAFCVWTALHPNIIPNAEDKHRLIYKAVLMVIALINPEGIAVFAFGQYREAWKLKKQWQLHVKKHRIEEVLDKKANKKAKEKREFTMEVAFFIVMGGFTIDESTEASNKPILSKHTSNIWDLGIIQAPKERGGEGSKFTATLTPAGFKKYLKEGCFDNCESIKREIRDKGKTNNIAKILSASQALWLGAECVARKASGLPLRYVN